MQVDRKKYDDMVKGPGKFEGEPAYVPYFWECGLDGGPDEYKDDAMVFFPRVEDIAIFPELANRKVVYILELSNGFVVEVC